jgi:hypothetical protein
MALYNGRRELYELVKMLAWLAVLAHGYRAAKCGTYLGLATDAGANQFLFSDSAVTNHPARFYHISAP